MARLFNLRHPLWLVIFVACGFWLNLGSVALFDVDEGAFSEATREMLDSGVWASTSLDGQPRYDKPILTYWMQALSVSLFGLNEFSLRLHSALSSLGWGLALFVFCRQFVSRQGAQVALLMFSSTLLITLIGRAATADALLNMLIALTLFDIYRYGQSHSRLHLYRTWLWLALGMLTKGPVAAAIPLLVSGLWFVSLGWYRPWLKAIFSPLGWLLLLIVLGPWLYFVWQEQGMGFFQGFLVEHNLNRFAQTKEGHGGHWYYYLVLLPVILLPYSAFLFIPLRHLRRLWRNPLDRFLLIWFAVVLVLVSLSQTQLPHYVLYGVTPLIVLFARHRRLIAKARWVWLFPLAFATLMLALWGYAARLSGDQSNAYLREMLAAAPQAFDGLFLATVLLFLAATLLLIRWRRPLWQRLVLVGLAQSLLLYTALLPGLAALQQEPIKQAGLLARQFDGPVVAYRIHMPSFSVYRAAITERRDVRPGDYVYTRADRVKGLEERFGAPAIETLYDRGGILLLHIAAAEAEYASKTGAASASADKAATPNSRALQGQVTSEPQAASDQEVQHASSY